MANSFGPGLVFNTQNALERSRKIILRTDNHSKDEIKEACRILRFYGDFMDAQRAANVEKALARGEQYCPPLVWDDADTSAASKVITFLLACVCAVLILGAWALVRFA